MPTDFEMNDEDNEILKNYMMMIDDDFNKKQICLMIHYNEYEEDRNMIQS